mgnify:CR=1 FL=1|jgi:hypothetical protein
MVLDYSCIDFSGILHNVSTMRKSELVACVKVLVRELQNAKLEHDHLDREYMTLLKYKGELMHRLRTG